MSSRAAPSEASSPAPRVLVLDSNQVHDVFDVLGTVDSVVRVRSPYLFEIGEELAIRIEQDGMVSDATARVRAHVGPDDARITELEISDRTPPRPMVSG
jgi:hypothetical protein